MRVLGVDPGLTRCGVGVVDGSVGRALTLVEVTVLRTPPDVEVGGRLQSIADALTDAIERTSPDVVAVERVFSQHNVRTVMGTAQVAGLAIVAASRAGIPVALHTPSEVKAGDHRLRERRQGPGGRDGDAAAPPAHGAPPGGRGGRAGPRDLPTVARAGAEPGCNAAPLRSAGQR